MKLFGGIVDQRGNHYSHLEYFDIMFWLRRSVLDASVIALFMIFYFRFFILCIIIIIII